MRKKYFEKGKVSFNIKYPVLYRCIYRTHNFIKKEILATGTTTQLFIMVPLIFFLHLNRQAGAWTTFCTVVTIFIFLFISQLLEFFIERVLKNVGSDDKFIFPGKHLVKEHGSPFKIFLNNIQLEKFQFATEQNALVTARLNIKGFKNSAWEAPLEEKFKRNLSHIQQNSRSILLIKDKEGKPVGFTHILAVKENTWKRYKAGLIGDNNFSATNVFAGHSLIANANRPYGLILFSVVAAERIKDFTNPKTYSLEVGDLLEQAIAFHLQSYIDAYFKDEDEIPVLFQNESSIFLKHFVTKGLPIEISYDGARIITFEITPDREAKELRNSQGHLGLASS